MRRCQSIRARRFGAVMVVLGMVGCATNEAIIHVEARGNTEKAARSTLLGVKAMDDGDIDRAVAKFAAAVEADEDYGPAHNNLGLLHYEQGDLYQAVLAFEQATELMPYDPTVYYNLGLTLESAGKVHEAMDLYWQAVEMDPAEPHFLGNLVRLRIRLGENGPDVITQLQDLVLIETRPHWRRWADHQLAIQLNDQLDRGPETPDFNRRDDRDATRRDASRANRIIDLSPEGSNAENADVGRSNRGRANQTIPSPTRDNEREFDSSPTLNVPRVRSKPIPMQDQGSIEELPPSIEMRLSD